MRHFQQVDPYGCIYFSFASLVQDAWFLRFVEDLGYERFMMRALRRGWFLNPIYVHGRYARQTVTKEFWEEMLKDVAPEYPSRYLHVSIPSLKYEDAVHCVGIIFSLDDDTGAVDVFVTDPGQPDWIQYTVDEFLASPYVAAYEVYSVTQARMTSFHRYDPHDLAPKAEPVDPLACKASTSS